MFTKLNIDLKILMQLITIHETRLADNFPVRTEIDA
jgi:hypothetical protein